MKFSIIVGLIMLGMGIAGIIKSRKDKIAITWIIFGIIITIAGIIQIKQFSHMFGIPVHIIVIIIFAILVVMAYIRRNNG